MPNKKCLVELGRKVLLAYDYADRPLGQALSPLKGRKLRPPKPQEEVDAGIGRVVWDAATELGGTSVQTPSTRALVRIGAKATSYIDSADLGHIGGTVEDVHYGLGRRAILAFDDEIRQLIRTDETESDPELSASSTMGRP
ncbi:hypothetical protein [Bradyrhizobium uaiense]|nr:hypothetical protein [Bradyrhizobium uaiense]